jgi:hypothetical protein
LEAQFLFLAYPLSEFVGAWTGKAVAFATLKPFQDSFQISKPGGPMTYTGLSEHSSELDPNAFIWRGQMSGVSCLYHYYCDDFCGNESQYADWVGTC